MKIALVHDYLTQRGGAERVFELLCKHFPSADIYTSLYDPKQIIEAASFCNGVVMVGRIGRVTQTELAQATAMLSKLNVIGIVANGATGPTYGYAHYPEE